MTEEPKGKVKRMELRITKLLYKRVLASAIHDRRSVNAQLLTLIERGLLAPARVFPIREGRPSSLTMQHQTDEPLVPQQEETPREETPREETPKGLISISI